MLLKTQTDSYHKVSMSILKILTLNVLIFALAFFAASLIRNIDGWLGLTDFESLLASVVGWLLIGAGLVFRFWASYTFYANDVEVLKYTAQGRLITSGPYAYTRNPLYIGIVLIFLGAAVVLGSYAGVIAAIILFMFWDIWVRGYEEGNLERAFGSEYPQYKNSVPRWFPRMR